MKHNTRQGILLAVIALLLWSTSASATVIIGGRVGAWQFLALATLGAGLLQTVACAIFLKMPLRRIFAPPPKLLALVFLAFVLYMIVYTQALVLATRPQKVGVGLLNFLWPTLTIVFAAFLVPGSKMTARLAVALALALAGVLLANFQGFLELVAGTGGGGENRPLLPYLLGLAAGVAWGAYSAMIARWKSWAGAYATCPIGFLATSAIAFTVCLAGGGWTHMDTFTWLGILYMAAGPLAAAYLLWELALHRAPPRTLGLLASTNAVASTLWLFVIFPFIQGAGQPPNYFHTLLAALLITLAIFVGNKQSTKLKQGDES